MLRKNNPEIKLQLHPWSGPISAAQYVTLYINTVLSENHTHRCGANFAIRYFGKLSEILKVYSFMLEQCTGGRHLDDCPLPSSSPLFKVMADDGRRDVRQTNRQNSPGFFVSNPTVDTVPSCMSL